MLEINKSQIKHICNFYEFLFIITLLVGYIIVSSIPNIFFFKSRYVLVLYRIFIFLFSVYIIYNNKSKYNKKNLYSILVLLLFWLFYFIKTIYSFNNDIYFPFFEIDQYEIYFRILIIIIIPCIAILSIDYEKELIKYLVAYIFFTLLIMLTINFFYTILISNNFNQSSGVFSISTFSEGHIGVSILTISLYFLMFNFNEEKIINKTILFLGLFLGLFAIYISASRSPVLAILIIMTYFVVLKKTKKIFIIFMCLLIFILVFTYISQKFLNIESAFLKRNYLWFFEGNTNGRGYYFVRAINIFLDNIFFGGRVLYENGMYPHNIFLELLMAGGIILLVLFFLMTYPLFSRISFFLNFSRSNYFIIPIFGLWIQYFILAQTSNYLLTNTEFWYFNTFIISFLNKFK